VITKQKNLTLINDIFFISEQIKKINKNYRLFYNKNNNKYEVHNINNKESFVISFDSYPNQNLIKKLKETSKENFEKLFKEIELYNKKLEEDKEQAKIDCAKNQLSEIFNYAEKSPTQNLSSKEIKKIIEKGD